MATPIVIISPSEDITREFRTYMKELGENVEIYTGLLDEAVNLAKELVRNGTKIIVSRTGNAMYLRNNLNIPVVSFTLNIGDFFESLNNYGEIKEITGKIALFWFKDYNKEFEDLDILSKILGVEIKQYTFNSFKQGEIVIKQAIDDGVVFGFGGVITGKYAKKYGMDYSVVKTTKDNLRHTINIAKHMLKIQEEERKKLLEYKILTETYNKLMRFSHNGILGINKNEIINIYNPIAEKILGINKEEVIGKKIKEVFPNSKMVDTLKNGKIYLNDIKKLHGVDVVVNRTPINIDSKVIGAVATFQDVKVIQKNEYDIRKKMNKKGHYAKYTFDSIKGSSQKILDTIRIAKSYANSDLTVLINGETGTGKELFAQSIHNYSKRKNKPFVALNCASLPENLLESELFGYEDGAFTGGKKGGRMGLFERAHTGTIFLDEIGEIPKSMQVKLLRVLQEKEIRRIGSDRIIPVDVRVVSATNKDLEEEVIENRFRQDLYYRINVLKLDLPNLNERRSDINEICSSFLKENHEEIYYKNIEKWDRIIKYVSRLELRGNIRELINILERHIILINEDIINESVFDVKQEIVNQNKIKRDEEKKELLDALNKVKWSKNKAAKNLGISRSTLWRKMKKYNLIQ